MQNGNQSATALSFILHSAFIILHFFEKGADALLLTQRVGPENV